MAAAGTAVGKVWHWRGRSFMRKLVWLHEFVGHILKSSGLSSKAWHRFPRTYKPVDEPWESPLLLLCSHRRQSLQWTLWANCVCVFFSIVSSLWWRLRTLSSGVSRLCFELKYKKKMHFSIPETEVRSGENGSTYVVSMINACFCFFQ